MTSQEFRRMWDDVRAGDGEGLKTLVEKFTAQAKWFGGGFGGSRSASDFAQDCLRRIGRYAADGRLDGVDNFESWSRSVLYNLIRDHARRKKSRPKVQPMTGDSNDAPPAPDAPPDLTALLDEVMARLSPEDRDLFAQHVTSGKSFVKLAAEYKSSPEALRKRFERARKRAAEILRALEAEQGNRDDSDAETGCSPHRNCRSRNAAKFVSSDMTPKPSSGIRGDDDVRLAP